MGNLLGNLRDGMKHISNRFSDFNQASKMAVGLTVAVAGTATGTVLADSNKTDLGLQEIYHVYFGDDHIGYVDNKEEIEAYIEERQQKAQSNHKDIDLVPSEEVNFVRELVFESNSQSETVMSNLDDQLTFATEAIQLKVNDQLIGHIKEINMANEALNEVINESLPENLQSEEYEIILEDQENEKISLPNALPNQLLKDVVDSQENNEEETTTSLPETVTLKNGSTEIEVNFTENVEVTKDRVNPTKLLEVEQLVKLIERGIDVEQEHEVDHDEEMKNIASDHNLSMEKLIDLNPELGDTEIIQAGDTIQVEKNKNLIDVVYTTERTEKESIDFETITKDSNDIYKGETKVESQGQKGSKVITYQVTTKNNNVINEEKINEEIVDEPKDKVIIKGTKKVTNQGSGEFTWPAVGGRITSTMGPRWGSYHKGIDIAGVSDRTIKAADHGTVVQASRDGAYGNRVTINHNNGMRTTYSHLSSMNVSSGQTVKKGQSIGQMGATGRSTGVHLHFEVYKNGSLENPLNYIGR